MMLSHRPLQLLVLLAGFFVCLPHTAGATPVARYLDLRREVRYDPRLTYSQVAVDWTQYEGRAFEIRGTLNGHIQGAASVTFMLTLPDGGAVSLEAPEGDAALVISGTRPAVRVLVRVQGGVVGNVVPLVALAVADEGEVRYRERLAEEALRQALARQAQRERAAAASRGSVPAGSVRLRPLPSTARLSEMARKYLTPEAQSIYPQYYAFIARWNKKLSAADADAIAVSILYFAHRHKVDPRLIVSLIIAESDFDINSTSHKGAMGLGQVMPDEARSFRLTNPYDPVQNIRASVNMLRMKLDMYRESGVPVGQMTLRQISLAMAAYNAGAGAVRRHGGIPPYRETQRYVQRVLALYKQLCGG